MTLLRYSMQIVYFWRTLYQNSYMLRSMIFRDLQKRYVGSLLGVFWSVIHPLMQLSLYYFVFSVILRTRLAPEHIETHFAFWLLAALLPWMLFADVVNRSPGAVLEHSNLIRKMVFPSEILSVVHLGVAVVNHLIGFTILIGLILATGYGISFKILFIFPYLFAAVIFALGMAWALSALNVFLRDVGQIIGVLVQLWFYVTPIVYPFYLIPDKVKGLYFLNPMFHVTEGSRMAVFGKTEMNVSGFLYLFIVSLAMFAIGGLTFKKLKTFFADVL